MLQKSRVPQIRGVTGEAVVFYRKPFTTKELRRHRLSHWVNNMAVFTVFMMSLGVNSLRPEKKSGNANHHSHLTHFAMLFMQL
jgi:hypothetical protein